METPIFLTEKTYVHTHMQIGKKKELCPQMSLGHEVNRDDLIFLKMVYSKEKNIFYFHQYFF